MTSFKKHININIPKHRIWDTISDLGAIQKFHPGVRKSYYSTDETKGIGAGRFSELQPAGKMLETVKHWDEGTGFLLQMDPIEMSLPIKECAGLFELTAISESATQVSLTVNYNMKLGAIGLLLNRLIIQSKMEQSIEGLLLGLKIHSEEGIEIVDEKMLQQILKAA